MDSETYAVFVTLAIDVGAALFIFLGFLIYRKCRGDKIVRRASGHIQQEFHPDFVE